MKGTGRDILIGVVIGAALVLFMVHHGGRNSSSSHPAHPASAPSSPHRAGAGAKAARQRKPAVTAHASSPAHTTPRAQASSRVHASSAAHSSSGGQAPSASHRSSAGHGPSVAHRSSAGQASLAGRPAHTPVGAPARQAGQAADLQPKPPGVSDELVAVASLIAIAAALSTVALTVRGRASRPMTGRGR